MMKISRREDKSNTDNGFRLNKFFFEKNEILLKKTKPLWEFGLSTFLLNFTILSDLPKSTISS